MYLVCKLSQAEDEGGCGQWRRTKYQEGNGEATAAKIATFGVRSGVAGVIRVTILRRLADEVGQGRVDYLKITVTIYYHIKKKPALLF